jgi:ATP-binding cassette subfamily B protein
MYVSQMIKPSLLLSGTFVIIGRFITSLDRILEFLQKRQEQPVSGVLATHSFRLKGKIRLENVSFRYDEQSPWILHELSFTIYPNQVVAIVGRSGGGKTTLANLIAGNLKPTTGRIFFDDFDSSFLSSSALRHQIGFIMQENKLFAGTLAENIAYFDDISEADDVQLAAGRSGIAEFIQSLPLKYGYRLAECGIGLSGGQRQKISVARTLYRSPGIILMDEATSALDAESESTLVENMKEVLQGKTAIIIAHRLSTIRNADRILVLEEGKLVEEGGHTDLLNRSGVYSELFQAQLRAGET